MTAIQEGIVIVGLSPVIPLLHPSKGTRLGMGNQISACTKWKVQDSQWDNVPCDNETVYSKYSFVYTLVRYAHVNAPIIRERVTMIVMSVAFIKFMSLPS